MVSLPLPAQAKTDTPPLPERSPKRAAPQKPLRPSEVPTDPWSDAEVAAAKAKCTETLSGIRLDFEPLPAFKQGLCGTAARILLRSIGSDTRVEIDPPATVTCELAKALSNWILDEVQPEAMALLDSPVVKLRASSYACRTCYNRSNGHLSEHALANAFDLSEFVLASGQHITIRDDWNSRFLALPLRNSLHVDKRVSLIANRCTTLVARITIREKRASERMADVWNSTWARCQQGSQGSLFT